MVRDRQYFSSTRSIIGPEGVSQLKEREQGLTLIVPEISAEFR